LFDRYCEMKLIVCIATAGDTITKTDYYTTVEEQKIFSKAFPEMVALFQQVIKGKEKQKGRKKGMVYSKFKCCSYFLFHFVLLLYLFI